MAKISVIIPIYNVARYARRCVDSVLAQTLDDIEIILVNDGSSDDSGEIIDEYKAMYPNRVTCIHKQNGGLSDARNIGIASAKGDYLFFLDGDDWIDKDLLLNLYDAAITQQLELVICGFSMINEHHVVFSQYGLLSDGIHSPEAYILESSEACNKLYKRELFEGILFPIGRWYEDLAVIPIVMMKAKAIGQINKYGYYYFNRSDSITKSYTIKILDILAAFDVLRDSEVLSDTVLERLYVKHLYFSLIRMGQVKPNSLISSLFKTFQSYTFEWFELETLTQTLMNASVNERLLVTLLLKNQFTLYRLIIKVETMGVAVLKKVKFTLLRK